MQSHQMEWHTSRWNGLPSHDPSFGHYPNVLPIMMPAFTGIGATPSTILLYPWKLRFPELGNLSHFMPSMYCIIYFVNKCIKRIFSFFRLWGVCCECLIGWCWNPIWTFWLVISYSRCIHVSCLSRASRQLQLSRHKQDKIGESKYQSVVVISRVGPSCDITYT